MPPKNNVPKHIAFIMDGNGRWAEARNLKRSKGHVEGALTLKKISSYCYNVGIEEITFYAFSTENWKRPKEEVAALMELLTKYLNDMIKAFTDGKEEMYRHTAIRFLGDISVLSPIQKELMKKILRVSSTVTPKMTLNIAINYGGRAEIVNAVNSYIKENKGKPITEEDISDRLYTAKLPDPDLIIRTAGEMRLSNFLIWQAAYSEFYSTNTLWPDFKEEDLDKAIEAYSKRTRKFGGLKSEEEEE